MSGRDAGVAQLVEHNLAMVGVVSSNLIARSNPTSLRIGGVHLPHYHVLGHNHAIPIRVTCPALCRAKPLGEARFWRRGISGFSLPRQTSSARFTT